MSTPVVARFGSGGAEPWADALRGAAVSLELVPTASAQRGERLDVQRWTTGADATDRAVLHGLASPLLDIGSGPGRMIRAAIAAGLDAYGVDADAAAVRAARAAGLPVLDADVFDALPLTGEWSSLLLLDGNIGIGGDVPALLARCAELLRDGGALVVETDPDPARDEVAEYRVRASHGGESDPFPWSRVGRRALLRAAREFVVERVWEAEGRSFVRLRITRSGGAAAR